MEYGEKERKIKKKRERERKREGEIVRAKKFFEILSDIFTARLLHREPIRLSRAI